MLHIHLWLVVLPRESSVHGKHFTRHHFFRALPLVRVQKVLCPSAASVEEQSPADTAPLLVGAEATLDKPAKRGDTGAGTDHDDRRGWILRQFEVGSPDADQGRWMMVYISGTFQLVRHLLLLYCAPTARVQKGGQPG